MSELPARPDLFRHDALLYWGTADFLDRILPFIKDGVATREPVMVVTSAEKIDLLQANLGGGGTGVHFADMAEVGANPARIIPFWQEFVDRHRSDDGRLRGIGEPIWRGRSSSELVECQRHESLINVAFGADVPMWLLCPYDTAQLEPVVVQEARHSHPFVTEGPFGAPRPNGEFRGLLESGAPFDVPLSEPPPGHQAFAFGPGDLGALRSLAAACACGAGLDSTRSAHFVLAAHEVALNSVQHGGGRGVMRLWRDSRALICDIADRGRIDDPLVDRTRPPSNPGAGRGLWLANQLCDLVQIRSLPTGNQVRLLVRC